jgi:3-deoxy-D-manno-octulosonic-acid transferase
MLFLKKHRSSFLSRLGFGFPNIDKKKRPLFWVHAVSMGETKAIAPFAKRLKERFPECILVISSVTETGHAEAKKNIFFADYFLFLPWDFSFIVQRIVKKIAPDFLFLAEGDLWYNFLRTAKANGAKIALLSGKISERSFHRFLMVPRWTNTLFSLIDFIGVQNKVYEKRFLSLVQDKNRVKVTGNLKFDTDLEFITPEIETTYRKRLNLPKGTPFLIIGSTHEGEEELLLDIASLLFTKIPELKIALVPRHPERFSRVAELIKKKNIPFIQWSSLERVTDQKLILVDTMGQLRLFYQMGTVAIVGGSFVAIGGDNILEPVWYGVPVLFGPHMHAQEELVTRVLEAKAGFSVTEETLFPLLLKLLSEPELRAEYGLHGKNLFLECTGSLQRTFDALNKESFLIH